MRVSNLLAKSKKNLNGVFNKKSSMKGFMGMTDLKFRFYSNKEVPLSKLSESFLSGSNIGYVEEMYRSWRSDKSSVHKAWDVYFTNVDQGAPSGEAVTVPPSIGSTGAKHAGASFSNQVDSSELSDILKLHLLIRAYQVRGHLLADLDPLKLTKREVPPELKLETYGWSEKDLDKVFHIDRIENKILTPLLSNTGKVTLREIVDKLKNVYCGTLAFEYMHIPSREECSWLRQIIETNQISFSNDERITILDRLMWADKFESFLKAKFPTVKRFGLEGVESMIPCMKAIIDKSSEMGVEDVIIGMPHRGRMNVLSTVLRKPLESIFSLFKSGKSNTKEEEDVFGSGDVKYHLGTSHSRMTNSGKEVYLSLLSNPSHLEAVNPLVLGKVRARQLYKNDNERKKVLGLLLHGDAAFAGQGVVYECFDYSELRGFTTGGTIHLVVNNQIGFTTDPKDSRSSEYCTAVAKTVGAPIFHVNADDPEACVKAAYLAVMWRQKTGRDVVIDLIGYRRHGHNENDNPDFTQPVMYQAIKVQPTTLNIYAQNLLKQGVVNQQKTEQMESSIRQFMESAYVNSDSYVSKSSEWLSSRWKGFKGPQQQARIKNTGVSVETLQKVGVAMSTVPENFTLHPILRKLFDKRRQTFQDLKPGTMLDWASAELLAYGTLLLEGNTVRISGQDVERGTFSHRHAVVTDQKDGSKYIPLRRLDGSKGQFLIYNSNLSEYAVLGFEAGFSLENPNSLVIWEAQFGDFANGAQIIIDQFISSGEQKWLRQSGLTMLLPHGYDGMGPEHSSARLERFLQMSDSDPDVIPDPSLPLSVQMQNTNMQIVNCTTPANIFHLLRRQIHREFRKPLIVMSPKNMLRLDLCVSPLEDFDDTGDHTRFQHVIPEVEQNLLDAPEKIKKVVFCSGQVYYTLLKHRRIAKLKHVSLVRVEQLAPFPFHLVMAQLQKYPNAKVVWAQEEPKNMGSWSFIAPHLNTCLEHINHSSRRVFYTGRAAAASPATGRGSTHISEEKAIIDQVFN